MSTESYDVIVIGSGVAGLYLAVEMMKKKGPKPRIVVVEATRHLGGRAYTFHQTVDGKKLQWEAGAGRISENHHIVRELMRRYKLTWVPIGGGVTFIDGATGKKEADYFDDGIPVFLEPLWSLPDEELRAQTVRQILTKIHGPAKAEEYLIGFPYRAEADTMRADMALWLFTHEFRRKESYGICGEGISAIVEGLRGELEAKGGKVLLEHKCVRVEQKGKKELVKVSCVKDGDPVILEGRRVVLAIPVESLKRVEPFAKWHGTKHLAMKPLLRFYAVFPESTGWAKDRIVTSSPIRYLIPGNPAVGSVQISYTDSQDAEYWKEKLDTVGEKGVSEEMLRELRRLVQPSIPPPTFVKAHYWDEAITYWLPGDYDPKERSKEAYQPLEGMPGVYCCGESFSVRQGWMEGALEHAAGLVRLLA